MRRSRARCRARHVQTPPWTLWAPLRALWAPLRALRACVAVPVCVAPPATRRHARRRRAHAGRIPGVVRGEHRLEHLHLLHLLRHHHHHTARGMMRVADRLACGRPALPTLAASGAYTHRRWVMKSPRVPRCAMRRCARSACRYRGPAAPSSRRVVCRGSRCGRSARRRRPLSPAATRRGTPPAQWYGCPVVSRGTPPEGSGSTRGPRVGDGGRAARDAVLNVAPHFFFFFFVPSIVFFFSLFCLVERNTLPYPPQKHHHILTPPASIIINCAPPPPPAGGPMRAAVRLQLPAWVDDHLHWSARPPPDGEAVVVTGLFRAPAREPCGADATR
jgi:hypothetical protein